MENDIYAPPNSDLERDQPAKARRYNAWQRFYITILWCLPIYAGILMLGSKGGPTYEGVLGSSILCLGSGILAILIPVRFKLVFVTVGVLSGLVTAYVIGTYLT